MRDGEHHKAIWPLEKQSRRGFRGYPLATVAFYGPNDQQATKVADDSPLAGVLVLFRASASEGTWTGHDGRSVNLFVAEPMANDAGAVHMPKQEFSAQPLFLNTNYDKPSMVVFKPGYVLVVLLNTRRIIAELQDVSTWQLLCILPQITRIEPRPSVPGRRFRSFC